jgi:ABC-type nitrate/sulfonate/bicarbonate transport system substrate-binding protein
MLKSHQAQLGVIWEPDTSAARAAGFSIAMSSKDVPDSIVDVIVAGNKLINDDPAAVSAVVRSFYKTMDGYVAQPTALTQFIAKDGNLDVNDAKSVIAGIKLYGTADADVFMNNNVFPLDQPQVEQSIRAIGSVLALGHPGLLLSAAVVDGSYVHQLAR